MKSFIIIFLFSYSSLLAQDLIVKKTGDTLKVKIVTLSESTIQYKSPNQSGESYISTQSVKTYRMNGKWKYIITKQSETEPFIQNEDVDILHDNIDDVRIDLNRMERELNQSYKKRMDEMSDRMEMSGMHLRAAGNSYLISIALMGIGMGVAAISANNPDSFAPYVGIGLGITSLIFVINGSAHLVKAGNTLDRRHIKEDRGYHYD